MAFKLSCRITIGKYQFTTVHETRAKRSMRNIKDTAMITLPALGRVSKGKSASTNFVNTRGLFSDGDNVLIELGYNGKLQTEFEGFVKRRGLGNPCVIECEGYSWQLRNKIDVTGYIPTTSAQDLLALATGTGKITAGKVVASADHKTDISVRVVDNLPLVKMRLTHVNGAHIVEEIKKLSGGVLGIFFISPRVLWMGLTYTAYSQSTDPIKLGSVNYRLGYNCIRDNKLKERTIDEPVQILYAGTYATGHTIHTASEDKAAKNKVKATLNNIPDAVWLRRLANEKQYMVNYGGLEGSITAFLEPFCWPGWKVNLTDSKNPEQNGAYLVESTEVIFGMSGARRIVELGPVAGFKTVKT